MSQLDDAEQDDYCTAMTADVTLDSNPTFTVVHRVMSRGFVGSNPFPALSIKCMFGGSARYATDAGQQFSIDDEDFLILGAGNAYTVEKDPRRTVETFCVFFPPRLVREVAGSVRRDVDAELDSPFDGARFNVYEHRRPHRGPISRRLKALRRSLDRKVALNDDIEPQLLLLMADVVREHESIDRQTSALPWVRPSTRQELFRRVHTGRDYLHANLAEPFSLAAAARAAKLSRYHFLRAFRQIVGMTPHRYVQALRLRRATVLLERSTTSISEISMEVGFASVAAFSTFFAKHRAVSPKKWRHQRRNKQHR